MKLWSKMIILMKIKLKLDSNTDERSQAEWIIFDVLAFLMAIIQSAPPKLALWWSSTNSYNSRRDSYNIGIPWNRIYNGFRQKPESFEIS